MNVHQRHVVVTLLMVATVLTAAPAVTDWTTGVELYNQGRFADATEHFRAVVKTNPSWPGGYLMLGRCKLALGEHGEALDYLHVAVDLAPKDPANVVSLSHALMTVDRHSEARTLLEELDSEDLSTEWRNEVARMRARSLLAEDLADDAVAFLEARLAEDPENAVLHRAAAGAYQAAGDRASVLRHLERTYALDPGDHASARAAVSTALALAAAAADDDDDLLQASYAARALQLAGELANAAPSFENMLVAGEAALGAGQPEAAAGWYAQAVKQQAQEPSALFDLGRTLAELDRGDEAIATLRTALGAAPDEELAVRIHSLLGRLLACRLELPEAARHYRAAGNVDRAAHIDELAHGFGGALQRLNALRRDAAELAAMEGELQQLGDAEGVAALVKRRQSMGREIAGIEANLAEVRTALCQ